MKHQVIKFLKFLGFPIVEVRGFVRLVARNADGSLASDTGFMENVITNVGLAAIAGLVGNTGAITAFSYLAVGTSSTTPVAADTTLGAEISTNGLSRTIATVSRVTTNQSNDTLQLVYTWTVSGSSTVQEIGIFNASSSGTMLAHKLTGAQALTNGQTFQATYQVIFA